MNQKLLYPYGPSVGYCMPTIGSSAPMVGLSAPVQPATLLQAVDEVDNSAIATNEEIQQNLATSGFTRSWDAWFATWQKQAALERSNANLLSPPLWLVRSGDAYQSVENRRAQLRKYRIEYQSQRTKDGGLPEPIFGPDPVDVEVPDKSIPIGFIAGVVGVVALTAAAIVYSPEIKGALSSLGKKGK